MEKELVVQPIQKKAKNDHEITYCIGFGQTISQLQYDNILDFKIMLSEQQLDFVFEANLSIMPRTTQEFIKIFPCYVFEYLDEEILDEEILDEEIKPRIHAFLELFFDENVSLLIVPVSKDSHFSAFVFLKSPTIVPAVIIFDSLMSTGFQHNHKDNLVKIIRYRSTDT